MSLKLTASLPASPPNAFPAPLRRPAPPVCAEFRLLDEQLAGMAAAVEGSESLFIDDSELARLATDVPDLRVSAAHAALPFSSSRAAGLGWQCSAAAGLVRPAQPHSAPCHHRCNLGTHTNSPVCCQCLQVRLGIGESEVFGSTGFSIGKLQMQVSV